MQDLISRQAAIDRINKQREHLQPDIYPQDKVGDAAYRICAEFIERLPSAQPDVKEIGYAECANAMLKMWIDNVLTDGEYNRIMDKLNKHEMERRKEDE